MENDKSNTFCVFCDKDKKVQPKQKPKPKPKVEEDEPKSLGPPNNYDMVLRYNEKKVENLIKKLNSIEKGPFEKIYFGEDVINLPDYPGPLNSYLYERITKYRNNKDYYLPKISELKKINEPNIDDLIKKLSLENELKCDEVFELIVDCLNNGIDFWFEYTNIKSLLNNQKKKENRFVIINKNK